MELFKIDEIVMQNDHAGTKATADISKIAEGIGFISVPIKMNTTADTILAKIKRQIGYYIDWNKAYEQIKDNSIVLLQHPFHNRQLTREPILKHLKSKKNVKYISIVHDVEQLRSFRNSNYYHREFLTMMELADVIVVHNSVMCEWFRKQGVCKEKLVTLQVFDYLQEQERKIWPIFDLSLTVAGNLDFKKCRYIGQLGKLENIVFNLYGPNFNDEMEKYSNIIYHGSLPVDEIPVHLKEGFGLVWDGDDIEGCHGASGQYLKYNNPHKLSLYLSSGMPVVIWKGAAEAEFVRKHGVGICVDSLYELSDIFFSMTPDQYYKMQNQAKIISAKMIVGGFATAAIDESINRIVCHMA